MATYLHLQFWHHVSYLFLSFLITVVVGQILYRSGAVFLEESFAQKPKLGQAINRLLIVGFYLINFGWLSISLNEALNVTTMTQMVERLAQDVGRVLLILGVMHFINVAMLNAWRKRPGHMPPVSPSEYFQPRSM